MRILITNIGIVNRTGTEIVAMDLARAYARAGHFPMIWTPQLRPGLVTDLAAAGVPVATRLEDLPCAPDVIHGHHHLETVAAVRHFPGVPALFVSHSGYWWHEAAPRHPAIRRYVAVDEFCREGLEQMPWMERDRIAVVENAVDMERFRPRAPLPESPQRALVFSNYAGPDTHLEPVREACRVLGIPVDCVGSGTGNQSAAPERVLPGYDLVFAKARCAIEAMAVGCAVVLCDATGLGTMVSEANLREYRRWNFGFRLLARRLDPNWIAEEIRRYDTADASRVTAYMRRDANLDDAAGRYLALYRAVMNEPRECWRGPDCYPPTRRLEIEDQAAIRLRLLAVPETVTARKHFRILVLLANGSSAPIATSPPWPCLLMYRWIDRASGATVVEHGFRSLLQPPSEPGSETRYPLRVIAPDREGDYVLRVTIIQEGWRWLDHLEPRVQVEAPIGVLPEA